MDFRLLSAVGLPQVDCVGQANGPARGLPGKLLATLQAVDGPLDIFDPGLPLLQVSCLKEVVLVLCGADLKNQLWKNRG